jgi:ribosomal protein S27E
MGEKDNKCGIQVMHYKPPLMNNKPQYVPIVVKNQSYLAGYLQGMNLFKSIATSFLEENGLIADFGGLDMSLDSTRFNNILMNGRKENELSDNELKEYYHDLIKNKLVKIKDDHPDNNNVFKKDFLMIECPYCSLGIYSFKSPKELPTEQFKCQICGNILIDYTDHYDEEFQYDKGEQYENI